MDFWIFTIILCILPVTTLTQQCNVEYDERKCRYNVYCTDSFNSNLNWQNFQLHSYYERPPSMANDEFCSYHDNVLYQGVEMSHIYLVYKNSQINNIFSVVPEDRGYSPGFYDIVYSLDLSKNDYKFTPVIRSMDNLAILNISRNHLNTAVLSNKNELVKLKDLDLSYNTISNINVNYYEHPYTKLQKINISHNYLVKIPDAVFDKIDDLQTLDLSYNYIEKLSPLNFEGTKSLLHLNLSNNRLTDINSSLFRFSGLKDLILRNNRIKELKGNDFEKLNKLENLDLSSNYIKTIDYKVFQNMAMLYSLDLSNNALEMMNKDMFASLISLKSINLSRNKLKSLPKDLFKNKTIIDFSISENTLEGSLPRGTFEGVHVTTLDLSFQLLMVIEDYAFNNMVTLNYLYLNNNGIYSLSNNCFKTLTGLLLLDLSNNKIDSMDFDKVDLTNLQTLFLRNNRLVQIKHEHFERLDNLQFLDLSENAISRLEPNSFKSLKSLIDLRISDNPLSGTLQTDTFDGLVSLPSLDISRNLLTTVQNASFNGMTELKDLNMSRCKIDNLQFNVFANTGYLETLDLSYNELQSFFVNMTELVGLSNLLLNNNLLKTISSTSLHTLTSLTKINLAYNYIENIEDGSFISLTELCFLDLSYNEKLVFTDNLLIHATKLNTLNLSGIKTDIRFEHNEDTTISEVTIMDAGLHNISALNLTALTHLSTLGLRNNSVSRLEVGAFSGLRALTELDLSFNKIYFIQPGVFKDNEFLVSLNISHNLLSVIGYGIFRGVIHLNTLDMSFNNIKDLQSERFYEVQSLTQLIVDHNKIESINAEAFTGTSLTKLSIGENPLSCHILVTLKKRGVPFEITAINIDERNGENIDGVTCNKDQERPIFAPAVKNYNVSENENILVDIRNILFNISNKNTMQDINKKYFENITNAIDNSNVINNENLSNLANLTSRVIGLNNDTNMLLKNILNSLHEKEKIVVADSVSTTTPVPLLVNNTVDLIPYINKIKKELEKTIADEKQNVINELENKFSVNHLNHHTESLPTSNEKLISNNEATKSLFIETCVALILFILVCLVLYKFYKSRMFIRSRMSFSTRELPGAMENSNL